MLINELLEYGHWMLVARRDVYMHRRYPLEKRTLSLDEARSASTLNHISSKKAFQHGYDTTAIPAPCQNLRRIPPFL